MTARSAVLRIAGLLRCGDVFAAVAARPGCRDDSLRDFAGESRAARFPRDDDDSGRVRRKSSCASRLEHAVSDSRFRLSRDGLCSAVCSAAGKPSARTVRVLDKQTWRDSAGERCQPGDHNSFDIRYSIQWDDPGPFNSQLNDHHAFMNLAEILMYVPDRRAEDTRRLSRRSGGLANRGGATAGRRVRITYAPRATTRWWMRPWKPASSMNSNSGPARAFALWWTPQTGRKTRWKTPRRITRYELKLMGGRLLSISRRVYIFLSHRPVRGSGRRRHGARELHRDRGAVRRSGRGDAAHEFFHVWNVKRIPPAGARAGGLYERAVHAGSVVRRGRHRPTRRSPWSAPGFGRREQFYEDLASQIRRACSRVRRTRGKARRNRASTRGSKSMTLTMRRTAAFPTTTKDKFCGVLLDLAIRDATDNRKSLDDVLRRMNEEYAQKGKFYDESNGIRAVVEEVAGKSFEDFFRRYVSGTAEIPYNDFLSIAGLELKASAAEPEDRSGATRRAFLDFRNRASQRETAPHTRGPAARHHRLTCVPHRNYLPHDSHMPTRSLFCIGDHFRFAVARALDRSDRQSGLHVRGRDESGALR